MNFDELVELISNIKKVKGEECLICNFPIDANIIDNTIKLNCNHFYHNTCIILLKKNNNIICPYCQKITNFNKIGTNNIVNNNINKICTTIIKTGARKGEKCNKLKCKRHKNKSITPIENDDYCKNIIKSGSRKGMECNRLMCKIHYIQNNIIV